MKIYLLYRFDTPQLSEPIHRVFKDTEKAKKHATKMWMIVEKRGNMERDLRWHQINDTRWESRCTSDGRMRYVILQLEVL